MNDIDRTLKGSAFSSAYMAADGSRSSSGSGDEEPRPGIDLNDMLEMGLESLLMHFRRQPGEPVAPGTHGPDHMNGEEN